MRYFRAYGTVVGSKYLGVVSGDSKDAAMDNIDYHVSFCHHCSHNCEDPEVSSIDLEEISEEEYGLSK